MTNGPAFMLVDSTKAAFPKTSLGVSSAAQTVQITSTRAVTITSVAIASSINSHQEFSAGTVTGCATDGTTSTASATTCSIPVTFSPYYAGVRTGALTVTDSTGAIYSVGLTGLGDGPTTLLTPTDITTSVGTSPGPYFAGDGGVAASGRLGFPEGVAVDAANNTFIADFSTQNIRVLYQSGAALACLIQIENPALFGLATGATSCAGATSAPVAGNIYTVAGDTTSYTSTTSTHTSGKTDKVIATSVGATTLTQPAGVALDSAGNIIIGNYGAYNVRVVYSGGDSMACLIELEQPTSFGLAAGATSCAGATSAPIPGYIYNLGGTGSPGITGDGGLASAALMANVYAVAADTDGDIFLVDDSTLSTRTTRLRVLYNGGAKAAALISATNPGTTPVRGYIYKIAGGVYASTGDGGLATSAGIIYSKGIAVDGDGDVLFTDYNTSTTVSTLPLAAKVRVIYNGGSRMAALISKENSGITPVAGYVYSLAGTTNSGTAGGNFAAASAASFVTPYGVAVNAAGDVFVADYTDRTVRRISSNDGNIYPYGGLSGLQGTTLGNSLTTGRFWDPFGIALGASGTVFVGDYGIYRLRTVSITTSDIAFATAVPAGGTGNPTWVYLTNLGNEAATVSAVTASANFTAVAPDTTSLYPNSCLSLPVLQPGDTCAAGAALQPSSGGALTGTLTITDNSSGNKAVGHTVNLSGFSAIQTQVALVSSSLAANAGSTVTYTATVTAAPNQNTTTAPTLIGTVTFTDGTTTLGSQSIDVNGVASIQETSLAGGNHAIKATFTPDPTISTQWSASSSTITEVVTAVATTTTVTTSKANAGINVNVTFTAKVVISSTATVPSGTPALTGSVAFTDGTNPIGSSTIDTTGTATLTINTLAVGTHTITATFTPTPVNYASSFGTVSQIISLPSFSAATPSANLGVAVNTGSSVGIPFTVTAVGGYSGTVKASCTNLPAGMSCTFSPASVVFSGGDNSVAVTASIYATTSTASLFPGIGLNARTGIALLLTGIFGFTLLLPPTRTRRLPRLLAVLLFVGIGLGITGCGKGAITNTPQRGTYNINVVFSDGTTSSTTAVTVSVLGN